MTKKEILLLVIACCGIIIGAGMIFKTARENKIAQDEYTDLTQYVSDAKSPESTHVSEQTIAQSGADTASGEETVSEAVKALRRNYNRDDFPDMEVDFDSLYEINPDVVAWLYVGAVGISYPVVQGKDNDEYLHVTFEGKQNATGCIIMDWEVNTDLTSWNTFIYGHNMKNGSMFGSLKKFIRNGGTYDKDPYIYIFLRDGIYRYKIFSYYIDPPDSKMYYTCDSLKEYRQYIREALAKSERDCAVEATEEDNMVTLVTCSGAGASKKRFFVHGIFQDRYLYE